MQRQGQKAELEPEPDFFPQSLKRGGGNAEQAPPGACSACFYLFQPSDAHIHLGEGSTPLPGPLGAMDGAHEPYLIGIWQFRCREPAWAAV